MLQSGWALLKRNNVLKKCRAKWDYTAGGGVVRIPRFDMPFPFSLWFILPNFLMSKNFGFMTSDKTEVVIFERKNCLLVDERTMFALPFGSQLVLDEKLLAVVKANVQIWMDDKAFRSLLGRMLTLVESVIMLIGGYGAGKLIEIVLSGVFGGGR